MEFHERLREARKAIGYTQAKAAELSEVAKSTYSQYESGDRVPSVPVASRLLKVLGVSGSYLMGQDDSLLRSPDLLPIEVRRMPLLDDIACGEPSEAIEDFEGYTLVGADIRCDYALRAKGDSMVNARIFDDDIVFIRQQPEVENGQIAAVMIDGETTLKRYYRYKNRIELRPENPTFDSWEYEGEEMNSVRVLGLAVAFQSDVR
ncbi:hypothetical protein FACS18949_06100 [Clostridia bacterium]|nr:hypothetical protein FACS189425_08290 [Clostridia bacterium]GHV33079.1 hypothetical protein FACS18949_06100 [Clostridia bacterium]